MSEFPRPIEGGNSGDGQPLPRIHRRTPMDGVRKAEGG